MKFLFPLLFLMGIVSFKCIAQQIDSIKIEQSKLSLPEISGLSESKNDLHLSRFAGPILEMNPFTFPIFPVKPLNNMNFNFSKVNTGTRLYGIQGLYGFPNFIGSQTYRINNKIFMGTALFSDKNLNTPASGWMNRANTVSTMFVGYKFSDKFSVHASFSISQINNPWELNP